MRDFKGMKRQRGRNRGGGGKPQQNANRAFDSNGPEGIKVRGNAQHVFEKYQQLARDATSSGDRVLAENYLQHAEHYFRLLRAIQPQRPASEILGRDQFASGFDIDFEDESGAQAQAESAEEGEGGGEEAPETRDRGGWQERPRDERPRDERRDDRRGRDRWRDRDDRPRGDRDERPRDDRRDRDERRDRSERQEREEPLAVIEPQAAGPLGGPEDRTSPVLRDAEGGESQAPAFLQSPARRDSDDEAPARRPRRRRAPRSFDGEAPATGGETEDA